MAFNGIKKDRGLTTGNITLGLLWFAVPMILGNLLQQFYNIADTLIVGQFLGANALAAVGWGCAWGVGPFFLCNMGRETGRH